MRRWRTRSLNRRRGVIASAVRVAVRSRACGVAVLAFMLVLSSCRAPRAAESYGSGDAEVIRFRETAACDDAVSIWPLAIVRRSTMWWIDVEASGPASEVSAYAHLVNGLLMTAPDRYVSMTRGADTLAVHRVPVRRGSQVGLVELARSEINGVASIRFGIPIRVSGALRVRDQILLDIRPRLRDDIVKLRGSSRDVHLPARPIRMEVVAMQDIDRSP